MGETVGGTDLDELLVHPDSEFGRDEQLPAEFADEAHPHSQRPRVVDVDLLRRQVWERIVRQVGGRELAEQCSGVRALHAEQRHARGDVGDLQARGVGRALAQHRGDPSVERLRDDHLEAVVGQAGDRHVGPTGVPPRGTRTSPA